MPLFYQFFYKFYDIYLIIPIVILFLVSEYFLFQVAFKDPGIIPRNDFLNGKFPNLPDPRIQAEANPDFKFKITHSKYVINKYIQMVKYCHTCRIYRPPRAHHCPTCGFCIEKFDHHCSYIGACIGKKNYFDFYFYLIFLSLECVFTTVCSLFFIVWTLSRKELVHDPSTFKIVLFIMLFIILGISISLLIYLGFLVVFHTQLIMQNETTKERIKRFKYEHPNNPFY